MSTVVTNNFNNQVETAEITINAAVNKVKMGITKTFLLAILAGAFIAFGAASASVAMHNLNAADVGLARLVAGCIFPVGLILIVVVGGELFTGNCLMIEGLLAKQITLGAWLKNLILVFIGNFVGAALVAVLVVLSTQLDFSSGGLGAFTIKVALGKTGLSFGSAFASGILCNVLVCTAVLGAFAARDIAGKILAIFFPIMVFIVGGYEHCIANMYYIMAGIIAAINPAYAAKAAELYGYNSDKIASLDWLSMLGNLAPVTLGNIVGGIALGLICFAAYKSKAFNKG
jgi:formate/nitrite transporter